MTLRSLLFPNPSGLILRIVGLAALCPLAGLLGGDWWFLDLFNHFQRQYAVFVGLGMVALLTMSRLRLASWAALGLVVPLIHLSPYYIPTDKTPRGPVLRAATFNVLSANRRHADALAWIRAEDPDFVFLPEVDPAWAEGLRPLAESHPYVIDHVVEGNFGFSLYSKQPVLSHEILPCGRLGLPLLKARLKGPCGDFTLLGAHPVPPASRFWAKERDEFLRSLAEEGAKSEGAVIAVGDLNATPWCRGVRPLRDAGFRDTALGYGTGSTWMRGNPILSIPIDHILYRGADIVCVERKIGPDLGSDHRPVVAVLSW